MTTTTTLPTTAADLHPPCPECEVTATDAAMQRAVAVRLPLTATRDQLQARHDQAPRELAELFAANKPTATFLEEVAGIPAELNRLAVQIAALSQAETHLMRQRWSLQTTDDVYSQWQARCSEINSRWRDMMARLPKLTDGASAEHIDRARRSALFGLVASVQSDDDETGRRLVVRGRR